MKKRRKPIKKPLTPSHNMKRETVTEDGKGGTDNKTVFELLLSKQGEALTSLFPFKFTPDKRTQKFFVTLGQNRVLECDYDPIPLLEDFWKHYTVMHLKGMGIKIPDDMLIEPDSTLSGFVNFWQVMTNRFPEVGGERRKGMRKAPSFTDSIEKLESLVEQGKLSAEEASKLTQQLTELVNDQSKILIHSCVVAEFALQAANYIAQHLKEDLCLLTKRLSWEAKHYVRQHMASNYANPMAGLSDEEIEKLLQEEKQAIKRRIGRKLGRSHLSGKYGSRADYEKDLDEAMTELARNNKEITQEALAEIMGLDARDIRKYNADFKVDYNQKKNAVETAHKISSEEKS